MTTETDNQRVSDAYRDIATQTTRPEMDERVLKLAATGTRSRYGLARAWVRPLAWAATIALSVTLVLELTQDVDVPGALTQEEALDERGATDSDLMQATEARDVAQNAAKRMPDARPEAASPAPLTTGDLAPLREAEEQARMRSADAPTDSPQVSAAEPPASVASEKAMSLVASDAAFPGWCDAEARATADSWHACIEDLLEEKRLAEAEQELEAFKLAFPDFEKAAE